MTGNDGSRQWRPPLKVKNPIISDFMHGVGHFYYDNQQKMP